MKKIIFGLLIIFSLSSCTNTQVVTGTFSETLFGADYSITVEVIVERDVVQNIVIIEDKAATPDTEHYTSWKAGEHDFFNQFIDIHVTTILGYSIDGYILDDRLDSASGATQSSARALRAVVNALRKLP